MTPHQIIACVDCQIELSGGLDTFGPIDEPLCQACWFPWLDTKAEAEARDEEWTAAVLYGDVAAAVEAAVKKIKEDAEAL